MVSVISVQSNRIHNIHTNTAHATHRIKMKRVKTVPLQKYDLAVETIYFE